MSFTCAFLIVTSQNEFIAEGLCSGKQARADGGGQDGQLPTNLQDVAEKLTIGFSPSLEIQSITHADLNSPTGVSGYSGFLGLFRANMLACQSRAFHFA